MPALPTKRRWKSELAASLYGGLAWIVRQLPLGKAVRKTSQLWDVVIIRFHIPSPLRCEAGTAETVFQVSPSYFAAQILLPLAGVDHQHTRLQPLVLQFFCTKKP